MTVRHVYLTYTQSTCRSDMFQGMGRVNVHNTLIKTLEAGLNERVKQGLDAKKLTQMQLSCLAGVGQGNLSAIYRGKPCSEATWQKLFDVAYPS
jgi:predicted XRE-type DNA-binding protein